VGYSGTFSGLATHGPKLGTQELRPLYVGCLNISDLAYRELAEGCGAALEAKGTGCRESRRVRNQALAAGAVVGLHLSGFSGRMPSLEDAISDEDRPRDDLDDERAGGEYEGPAQAANLALV